MKQTWHLWQVRGQGQLLCTHVVTARRRLAEIEAKLPWFSEDERAVEEVHYLGETILDTEEWAEAELT